MPTHTQRHAHASPPPPEVSRSQHESAHRAEYIRPQPQDAARSGRKGGDISRGSGGQDDRCEEAGRTRNKQSMSQKNASGISLSDRLTPSSAPAHTAHSSRGLHAPPPHSSQRSQPAHAPTSHRTHAALPTRHTPPPSGAHPRPLDAGRMPMQRDACSRKGR